MVNSIPLSSITDVNEMIDIMVEGLCDSSSEFVQQSNERLNQAYAN
jgi:hypothetical protein